MKLICTVLSICLAWKCYSQIDFPLEKREVTDILQYERRLGTKAVFHDEKREIGSLKLVDISEYQSERYLDVLPSGVSRELREVRVQRTNEVFQPSTYIYYYFSPKDSLVRKAEIYWNVMYHQTNAYNVNWFEDMMAALKEQKDRFDDYNKQFDAIIEFLSEKLGAPKLLDKEKVLKKEGTMEAWERKANWDTSKIKIDLKLTFSRKADESGFTIHEIKLTLDYK